MRDVLLRILGLTATVLLAGVVPAAAEVVKGKWYFGAGLAFHTTSDSIRSSAGEDSFADPRPSQLKNRETSLEDTVQYGLTVGFGLSDLVSLQLDAGYFRGSINPVQAFVTNTYPSPNPQVQGQFTRWVDLNERIEFPAGEITEIPVTLSGILRFRMDQAINPYVGLGAGMIFSEVDSSGELAILNERLQTLRIRALIDENGIEITPEDQKSLKGDGRVPSVPLVVDVDDAFEWHLMAGLEYFFDERVSLVVDARYRFVNQDVTLLMNGQDQINSWIFAEQLFRQDGSVRYFNQTASAPNPFNPIDPSLGRVSCSPGTIGDFDQDGHTDDTCYPFNLTASFLGNNMPLGEFLVQGGTINLSGYTISMAVRVYF